MLCIFCGLSHDTVLYMCEIRQAAMIKKITMLTARVPRKVQTTIPDIYRRQLNRETFIENELPIAILDSDEEAEIPSLETTSSTIQNHRQPTTGECKTLTENNNIKGMLSMHMRVPALLL